MINREEISKNIQRLLQGYADTSNDIKVTIRTPKEVDVYIDGELFNTYLIEEKKFKNNIVQSRKKDDDFKITIILSRDDIGRTIGCNSKVAHRIDREAQTLLFGCSMQQ